MSFIYTYTGRRFDPLAPEAELVDLEDIAHALANTCRYSGHTSEFYSVAQHSVLMAEFAPKHLAFVALMHDAAEAYITDMPRPLKQMAGFGEVYRQAEHDLLDVILPVFGIDPQTMDEIEPLDRFMLAWEQRDLMPASLVDGEWFPNMLLPKDRIIGWSPQTAKQTFLAEYGRHSADQLMFGVPSDAA